MTDSFAPSPAWIHKRDGRLVAFEADKISRALFAASESLQQPDAFLARELTDGVVHFLTAELDGAVPTTGQVAETVVKVVRELGRPALAQAFEAGAGRKGVESGTRGAERELTLSDVVRGSIREYTLRTVFARDLVAAQADGLLTLCGLETPLELAGYAVERPAAGGWTEALVDARTIAGGIVAVEGLEYNLSGEAEPSVARKVDDLDLGRRATGLGLVVNLNVASPPLWADDLATGPLFVDQRRPPDPQRLAQFSDALLQALLSKEVGIVQEEPVSIGEGGKDEVDGTCREVRRSPFPPFSLTPVRIDWHLSERDLLPEAGERLVRAARHALAGAPVAFVFDRPRRPVALAEGMDRRRPAVLMTVGLHLPRLLDQPGVRRDPELFLKKVGSLARLALSAGVQKREFLRRQTAGRPILTRGFLLERARFVAVPVGLENTVRALTGAGLCQAAGLHLGRRIIEQLGQILHDDGMASRLHVQLDSPLDALPLALQDVGVTSWDSTASVKNQLKATGVLHTVTESGTAAVFLSSDGPSTAEQIADCLRWAWAQTDVARLRWLNASAASRQLTLQMDGAS